MRLSRWLRVHWQWKCSKHNENKFWVFDAFFHTLKLSTTCGRLYITEKIIMYSEVGEEWERCQRGEGYCENSHIINCVCVHSLPAIKRKQKKHTHTHTKLFYIIILKYTTMQKKLWGLENFQRKTLKKKHQANQINNFND